MLIGLFEEYNYLLASYHLSAPRTRFVNTMELLLLYRYIFSTDFVTFPSCLGPPSLLQNWRKLRFELFQLVLVSRCLRFSTSSPLSLMYVPSLTRIVFYCCITPSAMSLLLFVFFCILLIIHTAYNGIN